MFGIGFKHAHYAELLENPQRYSGSGSEAVDFLEVHSENFFGSGGAARAILSKARQHWPISLHGVGLALGSAVDLDAWHLDQLADLVERTDPILVSDHACFARGVLPKRAISEGAAQIIHASDLLPIPFSKESLLVLCSHVTQVQERLKRPIAVENLSAYFVWNEADFDEPQFLAELVKRTGCKLLVDVNNIYVNALNAIKAGAMLDALQSCQSWLDQIPRDAVAEIHLAGHNAMNDIVIDDHSCAVNEPVWALYSYALQRLGQVATLVEWDTDVPPLDILLEQVRIAKTNANEVMT
ncbi:MAG: DUF692 domain-containing protein [Cytophagales bacterium]|nr:DUF692 domain-containing protein [Cytophagales bacterium]